MAFSTKERIQYGIPIALVIVVIYFIIGSITNPAKWPGSSTASMDDIVSLRQKEVTSIQPTEQKVFKKAPNNKSDIPAALKQFYSNGDYNNNEKMKWLATKQIYQNDSVSISSPQPSLDVNVYPFSMVNNGYLVSSLNQDFSIALIFARDGGAWKINNVVNLTIWDEPSQAYMTNWDGKYRINSRL